MKVITRILAAFIIIALATGPGFCQLSIPKNWYNGTDPTLTVDRNVPNQAMIKAYIAAYGFITSPDLETRLGEDVGTAPTPTEMSYVSGLASDLQAQLNAQSTAVSSAATINPGHHHIVSAIATGTADAMVGTFTPAVAALTDGMRVDVYAVGANTVVDPTFQYNALTAKTIVKGAATALAVGDIPEANYKCEFSYRAATDKWVLLNPAITVKSVGTAAGTVAAGNDSRFKYVLLAQHYSHNPSDGATVYFGQHCQTPGATENIHKGMIPITGTLVSATISYAVAGTLAEAGDYKTTLSFRYASADTTLDDQILLNSFAYTYTKTGLSVAVTAGQPFQLKAVYPTWPTTNPTTVSAVVQLVITPSGS